MIFEFSKWYAIPVESQICWRHFNLQEDLEKEDKNWQHGPKLQTKSVYETKRKMMIQTALPHTMAWMSAISSHDQKATHWIWTYAASRVSDRFIPTDKDIAKHDLWRYFNIVVASIAWFGVAKFWMCHFCGLVRSPRGPQANSAWR